MSFSLWILLPLIQIAFSDPTVRISILTGNVNATVVGNEHKYGRSFRGVRYAQPPVKELRYRPAQRLDPSGIVDGISWKHLCYQHNLDSSEDCLFLHIYTPKNVDINSNLPVLFWIHGGGFISGSGHLDNGVYEGLVNRGPLIVVSFEYRLGPFGFLSTRTRDAPGNAAVSDCIEALQWVRRYIRFFGGDSNKVTLGGQGSGAEMASFLSLTPQSAGLFKSLILQSGSAFGAAVMSYSEATRTTTRDLSIRVGCATMAQWENGVSFYDIVDCMQKKTASSLLSADNRIANHTMKWAPVLDSVYFNQRLELLAQMRRPLPVLAGTTKDEWLAFDDRNISHYLKGNLFTRDGMLENLQNAYEMSYWDRKAAVFNAAANKYIYSAYFTPTDHVNWARTHYQLFGELVSIGPLLRDAKYFAYGGSNVYLYSFDYLAPKAKPNWENPLLRGVPNGWDLQYIFDEKLKWTASSDDTNLKEQMGRWWTNFILYGNPSPSNGLPSPVIWPRLTARGSQNEFVSIGPKPQMANGFHPMSMFWVCDAPAIDGYQPPYC